MKHKLTILPVEGSMGETYRPYAIDDEVVFRMHLQSMMQDEAYGKTTQIDNLISAIESKTTVRLSHEDLLTHIREVQKNGESFLSNQD